MLIYFLLEYKFICCFSKHFDETFETDNYSLTDGVITTETIIDGNTTTRIEYFYDSYGTYGFSIDGTFYYYVKNLQGDVTQIRDENNNLIVSYVYDAWGKVLSVNENTTNNIGANTTLMYDNYYNMHWEYNADLNSGIVRPEHKPWAKGLHDWYWGIK